MCAARWNGWHDPPAPYDENGEVGTNLGMAICKQIDVNTFGRDICGLFLL
jgi:hypothetical protein